MRIFTSLLFSFGVLARLGQRQQPQQAQPQQPSTAQQQQMPPPPMTTQQKLQHVRQQLQQQRQASSSSSSSSSSTTPSQQQQRQPSPQPMAQDSQVRKQAEPLPHQGTKIEIPSLMSLAVPFPPPAPSTSRSYAQAAAPTPNVNEFAKIGANIKGPLPPIPAFPDQLMGSAFPPEVATIVNDYLTKAVGFPVCPIPLDTPPKALLELVGTPTYSPPTLTRHIVPEHPFPLPVNQTNVPGLTTHLENLLTSYYQAEKLFDLSLEMLTQRYLFTVQTYVCSNGGIFSNANFEPIALELTRALKMCYQTHRADAVTLACLRQEVILVERILAGFMVKQPPPPPQPERPAVLSLNLALSLDPTSFSSFNRKKPSPPPSVTSSVAPPVQPPPLPKTEYPSLPNSPPPPRTPSPSGSSLSPDSDPFLPALEVRSDLSLGMEIDENLDANATGNAL
jgi:hypothetical protein